jgi:membrane protease YdiL (CAAX protease family)
VGTETRNLVGFFALTFAATWIVWLASARLGSLTGGGLFGTGGPLFLLGLFAPAFVALLLTWHAEGRDGVVALLARIGRWNVHWRWYLIALGYMAAMKLVAAVLARVATGAWPVFGETPLLWIIGAILVSTWAQAGEELGWRGYALPRLWHRFGLGVASVLLGVIWALWHLPLFFIAGTGSDTQSFPIFMIIVTNLSVAMGWLYWKTGGSLLLVMLMHASINNTTGIVPATLPYPVHPMSFEGSVLAWCTVGVSSMVSALLLMRMRGAGFSQNTRTQKP